MTLVATPPDAESALSTTVRTRALTFWLGMAVVLVAVVLRVWELGNLPGVNGDEAWSGVQAIRLLRGESFAWRTPTGNPINVFLLMPLAALHALFPPSLGLLRSVSVVSGLAALAANWWFCRRTYDLPTCCVSTALLALLPINIAYSRIAWDASQSLLATTAVMYLPLLWIRRWPSTSRWLIAATLAFVAAVIVHPTNIFAAPLIAVPILYARRRWLLARLRGTAMSERPAILAGLAIASALLAYFAWLVVAAIAARMHGPADLGDFSKLYLRLLSGATVYEYFAGIEAFAGVLSWLPMTCNVVFAIAVSFAAWGWLQRLMNVDEPVDACLLLGWALMTLGFALVAGPQAIAPHFERYGICLIAPAALVLARGLAWWIEPGRTDVRVAKIALGIGAAWLPFSFVLGFFYAIHATGGLSHRAFRTAATEPKQAAFDLIQTHREPGSSVEIVAGEWWLYWPLCYLALGEERMHVTGLAGDWDPGAAGLAADRKERSETWYVEFTGSKTEAANLRALEVSPHGFRLWTILDYAQRPLISLAKPRADGEGK